MPDDKKPPRLPLVHRDYSMPTKRTTPVHGMPAIPTDGVERHEPTPPPRPGTITNEDLAMQNRQFDKRLVVVETRTERLPSIENKVDQLLLNKAEQDQKREIYSMDVTSAHMEIGKQREAAAIEVGKQTEISKIKSAEDEAAARRKIKIEKWKLAGKFGAGVGVVVEVLHRFFGL